ncbi:hypothetical protein NDU88_003056 [Pleurodeles waltl]|uniref:Uncharacterized protein n=1 Tax=Pleurodeles waltl TaxID=8319 RepID=A0AAV7Q7X9_PLEWA|nr:hypothetical protein NDU88_003056 [Pleurodeles waltl]
MIGVQGRAPLPGGKRTSSAPSGNLNRPSRGKGERAAAPTVRRLAELQGGRSNAADGKDLYIFLFEHLGNQGKEEEHHRCGRPPGCAQRGYSLCLEFCSKMERVMVR